MRKVLKVSGIFRLSLILMVLPFILNARITSTTTYNNISYYNDAYPLEWNDWKTASTILEEKKEGKKSNIEECNAPEWDKKTAYAVEGQVVSHKNRKWRNKWWTKGQEPGATGRWGVWEDLGPCDADNESADGHLDTGGSVDSPAGSGEADGHVDNAGSPVDSPVDSTDANGHVDNPDDHLDTGGPVDNPTGSGEADGHVDNAGSPVDSPVDSTDTNGHVDNPDDYLDTGGPVNNVSNNNQCDAPAWDKKTVYSSPGKVVSHKGRKWTNQWWARGQEPGTGGRWGVWKDAGECAIVDEESTINSKQCDAPAWDRKEVYASPGKVVSHKDRKWRNQWWTRGQEPGTGGRWSVWEDIGECASGSENTNSKPTVEIISPNNNDTLIAGTMIFLRATAKDSNGTIIGLVFDINDQKIIAINKTDSIWEARWVPNSVGPVKILATAKNNANETATSTALVTIKKPNLDNIPPIVNITSPTSLDSLKVGKVVNLTAIAKDLDGTIRRTMFTINGQNISSINTSDDTWVGKWTPEAPGVVEIIATATDNGNKTGASIIKVAVFENDQNDNQCDAPAWNRKEVYAKAGAVVSHKGRKWTNLWWTRGQEPGTTGRWGVWKDAGECNGGEESINNKPTVEITSPNNNDSIATGKILRLTATASDSDGKIVNLVFSIDEERIPAINRSGNNWEARWIVRKRPGAIKIVATAKDDDNESTTSSISLLVVEKPEITNHPPIVDFISPTDGQTLTVGETLTLQVMATDIDGTISSVMFDINGEQIPATSTSNSEWVADWVSNASGNVNLIATATDNEGATGIVATTFFVKDKEETTNHPPTVNFISPTDGQTLTVGETLTLQVMATDIDGTISSVLFDVNGEQIPATSTSIGEWVAAWVSNASGNTNITATAIDDTGLISKDTTTFDVTKFDPTACGIDLWSAGATYATPDSQVSWNGGIYKNKWWTQGNEPGTGVATDNPWEYVGPCSSRNLQIPSNVALRTSLTASSVALNVFPNPSKGLTHISVELPTTEVATLTVIDDMGKVVRALPIGTLEPGKHLFSMNIESLNTGIYFVRLVAGKEVKTSRLVILEH